MGRAKNGGVEGEEAPEGEILPNAAVPLLSVSAGFLSRTFSGPVIPTISIQSLRNSTKLQTDNVNI